MQPIKPVWGMCFYGNPSLSSLALCASLFYLPPLPAAPSLSSIVGAVYLDAGGKNEMQICGRAETQMFPHCLLISFSLSAWQETTPPLEW